MKRIHYVILSLLYIFLNGQQSFGQISCATDDLHATKLSKAGEVVRYESTEAKLLTAIWARRAGNKSQDSICIIPVVVHDVYSANPQILDSDAELAIQWLNEAFSNAGDFYHPDGADIPIQFCLAKQDPDGDFTTGLTHTQSLYTDLTTPNDDQLLKDVVRWDTDQYLNIWVVNSVVGAPNSPGVAGYATFPDSHGQENDGIVLEQAFFASTAEDSGILIHEVGHYLGLYHTFQNGCPNDDCMTSGDRICDTPPDELLFNTACLDGTNSCTSDEDDMSLNNPFRATNLGGLGDQADDQINYMDYSGLICMERFTAGQKERMITSLLSIRTSLLDNPLVCEPPCVNPIVMNVTNSALEIEVGQSVVFGNSSSGQTLSSWSVDGDLEAQDTDFNFSPAVQGVYEVVLSLENSEPGCQLDETYLIEVSCPIEIQIDASETFVNPGESLSFNASVTGASSFTWYVDGLALSNSAQFDYQFDEEGLVQIQLIADNGMCQVSSEVVNILVGICFSGRENNIWHMPNDFANSGTVTLDFNEPVLTPNLIDIPNVLFENHASICDAGGQLLYFSDGTDVLDRNYDLMENGDSLLGHMSSSQGAIFLKNPYNQNEYYLFTGTAIEEDFEYGLRYSIIDAMGNDGLGAVTEIKNQLISDEYDFEGVEIVDHCNGIDKWLVGHNPGTDIIYSFLLDENGPQSNPVISDLSSPLNFGPEYVCTFSPDGIMMASGDLIFKFDNETGEFEFYAELGIYDSFLPGSGTNHFHSEFSADGNVLYVSYGESNGGWNTYICQYDLTLPTDFIGASRYNLDSLYQLLLIPMPVRTLKRGSDDKIYAAQRASTQLSVINNPEILGAGAGFDQVPTFVTPNFWVFTFDNNYSGYTTGKTIQISGPPKVCVGEVQSFEINLSCFPFPIDWEYGGVGEFTPLSNGEVQGTFDEAGITTIIATAETNCGTVSDTLMVEIIDAPQFDLGPDLGYCPGDSALTIELMAGFDQYMWSTGDTGQVLEVPLTLEELEVTVLFDGCQQTDSILLVGELEEIDLGPDLDQCQGQVHVLDAGSGYLDYDWHDGSTEQTYTAYLGGYHYVTVTEPCYSSDTLYIDDCGQALSLDEFMAPNAWKVFPNPSDGTFNVQFASELRGSTHFEVYDCTGKSIKSMPINQSNLFVSIDLSDQSAGLYLLRIYIDGNHYSEIISLVPN